MRLLDQRQRTSLLMTGKQPKHDVGLSSPCPKFSGVAQMGSDRCLRIQWGALQEENTEFREPKSFIMGRKQAYPLLWRKILSLSSEAASKPALCSRQMLFLSFKAVH